MTDILYPSKSRRFMSEVAGVRRYHRNSGRAAAAAPGGVLWVAVCKGSRVRHPTPNPYRFLVA